MGLSDFLSNVFSALSDMAESISDSIALSNDSSNDSTYCGYDSFDDYYDRDLDSDTMDLLDNLDD